MQRRDDPPALLPLFDAVAAAPADDGPRHVLADALLERGDARGEFIALQLLQARGAASVQQAARARVLEQNHWRRWLVELPGVGVSPSSPASLNEFHRGFLKSCVLSPSGLGADSPSWRMVERIDLADTGDARELAAPALTRLSTITGLDAACLEVVLRGPPKPALTELAFDGPWMDADRGRQEQQQVLALTRFPSLRGLTLAPSPFRHHADWLGWLFAAPIARQLERLNLAMELPFDVVGLQAMLERHRLMRLKLALVSAGVRLVMDAAWLTVEVESERWLTQRAQALRNFAPHFAPFPYRRFEVKVGSRRATPTELALLGERFEAHAS